MKKKGKEKRDKYSNVNILLKKKKVMEDVDDIVIGALWPIFTSTSIQRLEKNRSIGNQSKNQNYLDHNIAKTNKNAKKSPRDIRNLFP